MGRGTVLIAALQAEVLRRFPEHQIYLRSNDRVRLLRVGTRVQVMAVATAALIAGWVGVATINTVADLSGLTADAVAEKEAELARMSARVSALKADVGDLRGDVAISAEALEKRQLFLASLLTGKGSVRKLAAMVPEPMPDLQDMAENHPDVMAPFVKIEREQLAFVDQATFAAIDTLPPVISGVNTTEQCGGGNDDTNLQAWINARGNATVNDECSATSWTNFSFSGSDGQSGTGAFNAGPYPQVLAHDCDWYVDVISPRNSTLCL